MTPERAPAPWEGGEHGGGGEWGSGDRHLGSVHGTPTWPGALPPGTVQRCRQLVTCKPHIPSQALQSGGDE